MESARRFRALLSELGLKIPEAAKLLHVSVRTLHNWSAGTHPVPYAVTKLLRLLRYTELPGDGWQGWHFSRGHLVTPEGRTIAGHESSWWSLLVLRAKSFGKLYEAQGSAAAGALPRDGAAALLGLAGGLDTGYSGPCSHSASPFTVSAQVVHPVGNHGVNVSGVSSAEMGVRHG